MSKTIGHAVNACTFKYKLCFVNQYMKEMFNKALNRKQTNKNYSSL